MLKTAIMKILRKGDKCPLEPGNYRPISLLSVFYKIGSGCMGKITGKQQKAYSRDRNIGSILLNLLNMMDFVNKKKMESLILFVDFKKAFDSIDTKFIDSALQPSTLAHPSGDGSSYSSQEDRLIYFYMAILERA